jgi:D-amino-acid dehydrogenase
MRIAVVGAGIVGVTTAYELAAQGHEVTVLERRGSVAEETSFANAGVLATACVMPWAAPGMPWKVLSRLLSRDASAHLGGVGALAQLPWIWRWWRGCRPAVHAANRGAMLALAQLSRQRMQELTHTLRLEYEQAPGFTVLLRSERELRRAAAGIKLLQSLGVAHEVIDAQRCRQIEPALNPDARLHAAIHLPQDGVGNCRHFAHLLKSEAQRLGAVFRFDSPVSSLAAGAQPALRLAGGEAITTDAVVVCAGVQANTLLSAVGLRLPLAPVHGYSVTAPLRHTEGHTSLGPRSAVLDDRHRGHHLAPGSACARGRRRRAGWSPHTAAHGCLAHALPCAGRVVSGRCTGPRSAALERRTPHAARRPTRAGRQRRAGGVAQPGPRRQRLDAGLRLGACAGRSHRGPRGTAGRVAAGSGAAALSTTRRPGAPTMQP